MHYSAYLKRTQEAAGYLGGEYVSLAGGYYGVFLHNEPPMLTLALDLDGTSGWGAWLSDGDGERCCDNDFLHIGWVPLDQLLGAAVRAAVAHVHS